jgi:hypothetical protein
MESQGACQSLGAFMRRHILSSNPSPSILRKPRVSMRSSCLAQSHCASTVAPAGAELQSDLAACAASLKRSKPSTELAGGPQRLE